MKLFSWSYHSGFRLRKLHGLINMVGDKQNKSAWSSLDADRNKCSAWLV